MGLARFFTCVGTKHGVYCPAFGRLILSTFMEQTLASSSPESRLQFLDYWRVIKTRKVIILLVFLLSGLTAFTVSLSLPKKYMASARIKVEAEKPTVDLFAQSQVASYDPYFLQTQ